MISMMRLLALLALVWVVCGLDIRDEASSTSDGSIYSLDSQQLRSLLECGAGYYASTYDSIVTCTPCSIGKIGTTVGATSSSVCQSCPIGRYSSFLGCTACMLCPPGSICPNEQMRAGEMCAPGAYAPDKGMTSCTPCPIGTYQSREGEASCDECGAGQITSTVASLSDAACEATALMIYTTDFYNYGYASSGAFFILAMALLVVGIMQRKKELAYKQSLALIRSGCEETSVYSIGQAPRASYIYRTASAGLSLGCELFIVFPGLLQAAPELAAVVIILRLLHMVVALLLVGATFTRGTGKTLQGVGLVKHGAQLHSQLEQEKFGRKVMPLVYAVAFLSLFDCTMLQYLPWRGTEFYRESGGFPMSSVLRWTFITKSIQSIGSGLCLGIFLLRVQEGLDDAAVSLQAKCLFFVTMSLALISTVACMSTLCLKDRLLSQLEDKEMAEAIAADKAEKAEKTKEKEDIKRVEKRASASELEDLRTSAAIDFGSTYSRSGRGNANANNDDKDEGGGFDDGDFEMAYANPMVAAAESAAVLPKPAKVAVDTEYLSGRVEKLEYDNKQLEEEVQAAKKECKTYRAENIALRDLIEQLQPGEELYLAPVV